MVSMIDCIFPQHCRFSLPSLRRGANEDKIRSVKTIFSIFWVILLHKGSVCTCDNRIFIGPLGRSLRSFACTAQSAHSLRSAPLCYARFARLLRSRACSLTHFAHFLPCGMVEIHEYVFILWSRFTGRNAFLVVCRNAPKIEESLFLWKWYHTHCLSLSTVLLRLSPVQSFFWFEFQITIYLADYILYIIHNTFFPHRRC